MRIAAQRSEEPLADKFEEVVNLVCGHIRALEAANFRLELQDWRVQKVIRGKRKKLIKVCPLHGNKIKGCVHCNGTRLGHLCCMLLF